MKYQRVLITGCGGMLGNALYPCFRERVPHALATDRQVEPDYETRIPVRAGMTIQQGAG